MILYDKIVSRFLFAALKKAGKWFKIKEIDKKDGDRYMSSYGRSKRVKREKSGQTEWLYWALQW